MYEESQSRVNELTTINVNLSSSRAKIEQELHQLVSDYEEVSKELRVSRRYDSCVIYYIQRCTRDFVMGKT